MSRYFSYRRSSRFGSRKPRRFRTSRDTINYSKAAWQSQRIGERGRAALAVLQDKLQEDYGPQFESAIRQAKTRYRIKGARALVVFVPTMERAMKRMQRKHASATEGSPAYRSSAVTLQWYKTNRWPFSITSNPYKYRDTAIVVWDSAPSVGFNAHHWAERRKSHKRDSNGDLVKRDPSRRLTRKRKRKARSFVKRNRAKRGRTER
jgi:hypothetical protein